MGTGLIIAGSIVLVLALSIIYLPNALSENPLKEKIYVHSVFGCVPLKDNYTLAEWNAWQDLQSKVFGFQLERCN